MEKIQLSQPAHTLQRVPQQTFFRSHGQVLQHRQEPAFFNPAVTPVTVSTINRSPTGESAETEGEGDKGAESERDGSSSGGGLDWYGGGRAIGAFMALGGQFSVASIPALRFRTGLPKKLLMQYIVGRGATYQLSLSEMHECNVDFDLNDDLFKKRAEKVAASGEPMRIWSQTKAIALLSGTLNQFTVKYNGTIYPAGNGNVNFLGEMSFHDDYDFDPHPGATKRSWYGQMATGYGSMLTGTPFKVTSLKLMVIKRGNAAPHW